MPVVLETQRLRLRELGWEDLEPLAEILSDEETMAHYPAPFDRAKVERWISWNLENYRVFGFGLWAVEEKGSGAFLGDCGITIQNIDGVFRPEIGGGLCLSGLGVCPYALWGSVFLHEEDKPCLPGHCNGQWDGAGEGI